MKVERRVFGNVAILGTGELIAQFANFAFVVLIARAFGPELLGHYSLFMAVSAVVAVFVSFGTMQLHIRNIGRDPDHGAQLLRALFPVQLVLAVVAWVGIVSVGAKSGLDATGLGLLAVIAGYQILVRMTGILLTEAKGRQRMRPVAVVHASTPMLILGATSILVWLSFGPVVALSVMPVVAVIFTIFAGKTAIRLGGPIRLRWNPSLFKAGLQETRPYFAIMLLTSAYERSGVIILGLLASPAIVGEFAAGERMVAALGVLISVFTTAALPALSSLAGSDHKQLIQVGNRLIRVAWLVGLPVATVISLFSPEIIDLFFGQSYSGSSAVLAIASILLVIRALRAILGPMAMATGQPGDLALARAIALVSLICGAPFLVTWFGAKGLAAMMVISEAILLTILVRKLAAAGNLPTLLRPALSILAACAVAYAVGLLGADWSLLLRIVTTLSAGLVGLWLFRAIRTADIQFVIETARRKGPTDADNQ